MTNQTNLVLLSTAEVSQAEISSATAFLALEVRAAFTFERCRSLGAFQTAEIRRLFGSALQTQVSPEHHWWLEISVQGFEGVEVAIGVLLASLLQGTSRIVIDPDHETLTRYEE